MTKLKLEELCPDAEGASRYGYKTCEDTYGFDFAEQAGPEEFCNCYASAFSAAWMEAPIAGVGGLRQAGVKAIRTCKEAGVIVPLSLQSIQDQ